MKKIALIISSLVIMTSAIAKADVPHFDSEGVYRIPFGTAAAPIISCSPDKACAIQLEANEIVYEKVSGDTVRWQIVSGISGPKANIPILFFKPTDVGTVADPIATNLIITTNRRTYEIRLQAVRSVSRTRYGFTYGSQSFSTNNNTPLAAVVNKAVQETMLTPIIMTEQTTTPNALTPQMQVPNNSSNANNTLNNWALDHNYRVLGNTDYRPIGVWNDGVHTYIQMPKNALTPSIYSQPATGPQEILNIHGPINDIYSIDGLPGHIVLIGAVGKKVPHIDIYRVQ